MSDSEIGAEPAIMFALYVNKTNSIYSKKKKKKVRVVRKPYSIWTAKRFVFGRPRGSHLDGQEVRISKAKRFVF